MRAMIALGIDSWLRRMAVMAVLVCYATPLALGAMSDLSHGASHLLERIQERQARAAAFGAAHGSASSDYVHTHDGVTHSHAGAVDALLSAADQAEEQDAAAPVVKLSVHTPADAGYALIALAAGRALAAVDVVASDHPRPLPPLPPPRG
jgi:hypothetical protein